MNPHENAPPGVDNVEPAAELIPSHPRALLTVDEQTPLADVDKLLGDDDDALVLVADADRRVIGAVAGNEIRDRLCCEHEMERRRWQEMPVGSLMPIRIPTAFTNLGWVDPDAARNGDDVSSFVCGGDIYISWRKLSPELRGAFRDRLTGLPNRAGMEFHLDQDWQRAQCGEMPLAIMIVDLDRFKCINDTHGHIFADGVLREVAHALKSSVRSYDVVTRYGGDEFVTVCVGCGPGEIEIPVRRMLEGIREVTSDAALGIDVSASIGAAVCQPATSSFSAVQLLQAADECLYAAKKEQRGCAFVSDLTVANFDRQAPYRIDGLHPVA